VLASLTHFTLITAMSPQRLTRQLADYRNLNENFKQIRQLIAHAFMLNCYVNKHLTSDNKVI